MIQKWKEEARQSYRDQQSQDTEGGCGEPIGYVYGYLAACKKFEKLQKDHDDMAKIFADMAKLSLSREAKDV